MSPRRLVDTFPPPHDDIHTLYDVLESSVAQFGDVSAFAVDVKQSEVVVWIGATTCMPAGSREKHPGLLHAGCAFFLPPRGPTPWWSTPAPELCQLPRVLP